MTHDRRTPSTSALLRDRRCPAKTHLRPGDENGGRGTHDVSGAGQLPAILDGWIGLGWGLRSASTADRGLLELVILRVAQLNGSEYVWRSHWRAAVKAGVHPRKLHALSLWRDNDVFTGSERAVLAITDALSRDGSVPDTVWSAVTAEFDDRQRVELVMTISWYCCVARVAAGLQVPLEHQHAQVPALDAEP